MFRLHVDVPIGTDKEESILLARDIIEDILKGFTRSHTVLGPQVKELNYRLGHDDDRQRSNYLDMDENNHCSNKKIRLTF